jgi:uncharacterized lipoprotein YehR (DUF1307 family)
MEKEIMKKLVLVVMAMVMCFTLVACGGNNDANNEKVLEKINELEAIEQEIYNVYNDNGLLGDDSADKVTMDEIAATMEQTKADHQKIVDGDGYSDEDTVTVIEAFQSDIDYYQGILDQFTE